MPTVGNNERDVKVPAGSYKQVGAMAAKGDIGTTAIPIYRIKSMAKVAVDDDHHWNAAPAVVMTDTKMFATSNLGFTDRA